MSRQLLEYARKFANGEFSAIEFSNGFIEQWRRERNSGMLLQDSPTVSEALSTIFCIADLYNPATDREAYEFDEEQLKNEVKNILG